MFIADVPTPIGLPFAFSTEQRTSGSFFHHLVSKTIGYFLPKMAAIILLERYIDLATLGDYYTNGSYG